MGIYSILQESVAGIIKEMFAAEVNTADIIVNHTRKEFEGHYTIVIFPYAKIARKNPAELAGEIGGKLVTKHSFISKYSVVKGFLNLTLSDSFWKKELNNVLFTTHYGNHPSTGKKVLIEYSSPNTNKPLHLGHIRNILLGWSCANILEAAGYQVVRTQIVNDRGIAICKSMLTWKKFGSGKTPKSTGMKSDHFVGEYYVEFENRFKEEYILWQSSDQAKKVLKENGIGKGMEGDFFKKYKNEYFNEYSDLGNEVKELLLSWEAKEASVVELWTQMNQWVYDGFQKTYDLLGIKFDCNYYESETYLLGKDIVKEGLQKSVFYRREDNSIWVNLEDSGLDHKIILRKDGTSVYITQDLGTADLRYRDHKADRMVYVVADEQEYHFQVLFEVMKKMKRPYTEGMFHLAYGMVDLPEGKMKSREGTVVDADDLIAEVIQEARKAAEERGEIAGLTQEEKENIYKQIGLAALKFFIIKVHPKKRIIFDPKESVDLQGQTGPYVQNAYVRIQSVLRKLKERKSKSISDTLMSGKLQYAFDSEEENQFDKHELVNADKYKPDSVEIHLIRDMMDFPRIIRQSAENYEPSEIANYSYQLAKGYHKFYHDFRILNAESEEAKMFRLNLSMAVANILEAAFKLLGIDMPQRM